MIFTFLQIFNYLITIFVCTSLLIRPLRFFQRILLGCCYTILCITLGPSLGQFVTPIYLLSAGVLIYLTTKERVWNLILFQLGWFWFVLTDYMVSVPMELLGYPAVKILNNNTLYFIYSLLHAVLSLIPAIYAGHLLRKKSYSHVMQIPAKAKMLLFIDITICSAIYQFNIIYGDFNDYSNGVLMFNGILFFLYLLSNILLFFFLYRIMSENNRLALEAKDRESLVEYTQKLERLYQNIRIFKHDYVNLIATMNCYIEEADIASLKQFFQEKILPNSEILSSQDMLIGKLSRIKVLELKGILYVKLMQAIEAGLQIQLEIEDDISTVYMDSLDLCKITGIFLDNAIEAARDTAALSLVIALIQTDNTLMIHIENSTLPITKPLEHFPLNGFTTKDKTHSGIGLYEVNRILSNTKNAYLDTHYHNGVFTQKLELVRESTVTG